MKKGCPPVPPAADRILGWLYSQDDYTERSGDLEEAYADIAEEVGLVRAKAWLWLQIMKLCLRTVLTQFFWSFFMLKHHLINGLRHIQRHKVFSFISITGLVAGMTVSILLVHFIRYELSFDGYHDNADSIFRITDRGHSRTQADLAGALRQDFPEVLQAGRLTFFRGFLETGGKTFEEETLHFADPEILDIFRFPSSTGAETDDLSDPFALLITERAARKLFGNENPLGRVITFVNAYDFTVRGILKDVPENSHYTFDFLSSMATLKTLIGEEFLRGWSSREFFTYIRLAEQSDPELFTEKLEMVKKKYGLERPRYSLQPLKRIHISGNLQGELNINSDIKYITFLIIISAFILLIVCLNYINMSTAGAAKRMKEVALKKVVGSNRWQLMKQFWGESFLHVTISMGLSLGLAFMLLPSFNTLIGRNLRPAMFLEWEPLLILGSITLLIGLISGSYPAVYLSAFSPAEIMRGSANTGKGSLFRNGLVIIQFVVTTVLVIGSMVVHRQLNFIQKSSSPIYGEPVVLLRLGDRAVRQNHGPLMDTLLSDAQIHSASASFNLPFDITTGSWMTWEGQGEEEKFIVRGSSIDTHFIDFYNLEIIRGRNFSSEIPTDLREGVLLNETAARLIGAEDILGKRVSCGLVENGTVVGIIKDFNFKTLYQKIEPLALVGIREEGRFSGANFLALKISPEGMGDTLGRIKRIWKTFSQDYPFLFSFLDDRIDRIYGQEIRFSRSIRLLTFLEILLACLGLIGLSLFTAKQRTREIGIRKVLGATTVTIAVGLFWELTKWILVSSAAAFPIAYFIMNRWLRHYEYHTALGFPLFALSALLVFAVAALTVSCQALKSAAANPADTLRHE